MSRNCHQIAFITATCSITLTPAGIKKNAMLERRKSLFSLMLSILRILVSSNKKSNRSAIRGEGIKIGKTALISSLTKQIEKIIAI